MKRLLTVVGLWWALTVTAHAQVIFSEDFNTATGSPVTWGLTDVGYSNRGVAGEWDLTHSATGGWNGTGASHWFAFEKVGIAQMTWGLGAQIPGTFSTGDAIYIRFRYKQDTGQYGWNGADNGNKLILMGNGNGRVIIFQNQPNSLDFNLGGAANSNPPDYGFNASITTWAHASVAGKYIGIDMSKGVGGNGTGAGPLFVPPVGDAQGPADGWHHIQMRAISGDATNSRFSLWHNNNTEASPTRDNQGIDGGLDTTDWGANNFIIIGGSWGNDRAATVSWLIDDFVVARSFDSAWDPGAAESPAPRMRLRIRGEELALLLLLPLMVWRTRTRRGR